MDATDEAVLGIRKSQSTSADSVSVAAGMSNDPITLSEGSTRSPEPDRDDDAGLASGTDSSSEDRRSSRRKRLHSQVFGSDDEDDDEPSPPSSQALGLAVRGVPPLPGNVQCIGLLGGRFTTRTMELSLLLRRRSQSDAYAEPRQIRRATGSRRNTTKLKKHKKHCSKTPPVVRIGIRHRDPCQPLLPS
ncbi:hypothetical protein JG688_00010830 [Phytophthora aleatoria]|uniref:Uncharacterized protein n=1 Tax=Phytophthora aleatoria TaxID=2496075 RepID=A0A8J5J4L9_9STRA|nr:hypothetical protein JG688_00010830 [Phytophthora aleatoria]